MQSMSGLKCRQVFPELAMIAIENCAPFDLFSEIKDLYWAVQLE